MKLDLLNVLIVEDEFVSTEYLKDILESFGINNIFEAQDSKQAIAIVKENSLDFIFMDINIKGDIDGIRCAQIINKICDVPIIFTTAYADKNTILEADSLNTFGYVIKPFTKSDIEASLMVACSQIKRLKKQDNNSNINSSINNSSETIFLGDDYEYNLKTKTLKHLKVAIKLTKKELELIDIFCSKIDQNLSYEYLQNYIWNEKHINTSAIREVVFRLKKKIPTLKIENISNYGYILKSNN